MRKVHGERLDMAEMRMVKWTCRVIKLGRKRNERIRGIMGDFQSAVHMLMTRWWYG